MDTKSVGMIGLGLMGTALTERLLRAGYTVWVFNRTRRRPNRSSHGGHAGRTTRCRPATEC